MEKKVNKTTSTFVVVTGRVGSVKEIANSNSKQTFVSLAVNRKFMVDNEKKEETDWHDIVFYNKLSEIINQYVKKGDKITVYGEIEDWSNDEKSKTVIKGNSFNFDTSSPIEIIAFLENIKERESKNEPLHLTVFTLRKIKINEEKKLKKDFHNIICTGDLANALEELLVKNVKLLIKGDLQNINQDGNKISIIKARKVNIL